MIASLEMQKAALTVVVRYRQQTARYRSIDDAVAELQSEYPRPNLGKDSYRQTFEHLLPLYDAAVAAIRSHPVADLPRDPKTDIPDLDHLTLVVRTEVDGYADEVYRGALRWAFFWWILR